MELLKLIRRTCKRQQRKWATVVRNLWHSSVLLPLNKSLKAFNCFKWYRSSIYLNMYSNEVIIIRSISSYYEGSGVCSEQQWHSVKGRKRRRKASWETVNQKCVCVKKLISTTPGCGFSSDTSDMSSLGITPTHSRSPNTRPCAPPIGSAFIHLPRSSTPNSLGRQLDFHSLPGWGASFGPRVESATVGQYTQDYSPPEDGDVKKKPP